MGSHRQRKKIDDLLDAGWSRELAWVLGMVYGDGHVAADGDSVGCSGGGMNEEEALIGKQLLERWRDLVAEDALVTRDKDSKFSYRVDIYNRRFNEWCTGFGLVSPKSAALTWPQGLPPEFYSDFVRGLWDADGSSSNRVRKDNRTDQYKMSCFLKAKSLMEDLPLYLPTAIPMKLKCQLKTKGDYTGNEYWGYELVSASALALAEWLYGNAPASMRHESKWHAFNEYKTKTLAGCTVCGNHRLYRLWLCKPHYVAKRFPIVAKELQCKTCGTVGTVARSLCQACYMKERRGIKSPAMHGKPCTVCGTLTIEGKKCRSCVGAERQTKVAQGAFGICPCGGNTFVKGLCRKCYDRLAYRKNTGTLSSCVSTRYAGQRLATLDKKAYADETSLVEAVFEELKRCEFPALTPSDVSIRADLNKMLISAQIEGETVLVTSNGGQAICGLANQHILAEARNRGNKSPKEAFKDSRLLRKAIALHLRKGGALTPKAITKTLGFLIHAPSNFPPVLAKWIIDSYCPTNGVVVDPCIGFGGRLLGSLVSNKNVRYEGCDVSARAVDAAKSLVTTLRPFIPCEGRVKLTQSRAEAWDDWPECDLVVTSPPYFEAEVYRPEEEAGTSYGSYFGWREKFLRTVLTKAHTNLRLGRYLVLIVADAKEKNKPLPIIDDCKTIAASLGFTLMDSFWLSYARGVKSPSEEVLLVFRKAAPHD